MSADLRVNKGSIENYANIGNQPIYAVVSGHPPQDAGETQFAILYKQSVDYRTAAVADIAYPYESGLNRLPVVGETVEIVRAPGDNREFSASSPRTYYKLVNVHNHPHHGAYFYSDNPDFGAEFTESSTVNPMRPFAGDTLIQGRFGQNLRLGQSTGSTPWKGDQGSPILILSNGQIETEEGFTPISEDINQDYSSIYLTAPSQYLDLTLADHIKFTSNPEEPKFQQEFTDSQVIINGDRLHFNSKKESILLTSSKYVSAAGEYINLEASKDINVHAEKIYLHNNSKTGAQPAALGQEVVDEFMNLYNYLEDVAQQLGSAGIALTALGVPNGGLISQTSIALKAFIEGSRNTLKKRILSDKVFLPTKDL